MEVDPAIAAAIDEAVKAGVFRRAAKLNPMQADIWNALGADHTSKAATLLYEAVRRIGASDARPGSQ